jgi:VCBS repeat protein/FG-GAP repeat protein
MLRPLIIFAVVTFLMACPPGLRAQGISFRKTVLDTVFRAEGVAVGDFNKDGKADIAAGTVWYEQPAGGGKWEMRLTGEKAPEYDPKSYSHAFQTFADDLNGDGWTDIVVVDWPGAQTYWLQNPQQQSAGPWKQHIVTPVTNNESPQFVDVDGDGKLDLLAAFAPDPKNVDGPMRRMGFMTRDSDATQPWAIHAVSAPAAPSTNRYSHGVGLGDINGDRRKDILSPQGWWEAPSPSAAAGEWTFHAAPLGQDCAQMYAYDFDGDGDNDVLSTAAHRTGLWWHEQLPGGKWATHQIDDSITQTHALMLADINSDGLPDFVTGKRWWAHGPTGDDRPGDPAVVAWYELRREGGRPKWTQHMIDHDSGVGTQFEVADVNADGLLDVITANKKGVHYFEQTRSR